jgi:hypothetical protein
MLYDPIPAVGTEKEAIYILTNKLASCNIDASTSGEILALAAHCFILQQGYACVQFKDGEYIDLPNDKLLPDDWNTDFPIITLHYRGKVNRKNFFYMQVKNFHFQIFLLKFL